MTDSITRNEYWLLELVSELRYPVSGITSVSAEALNRPVIHLSVDDASRVLHALATRSLIQFKESDSRSMHDDSRTVRLDLPQITDQLKLDPQCPIQVFYGLTAEGGKIWETAYRADWNRYLSTNEAPLNDNWSQSEVEIVTTSRHLTDQLSQAYRFSLADHGQQIHGEGKWDIVSPWRATYWKSLSEGHRVRYIAHQIEGPVVIEPTTIDGELAKKITAWRLEHANWYQSPISYES